MLLLLEVLLEVLEPPADVAAMEAAAVLEPPPPLLPMLGAAVLEEVAEPEEAAVVFVTATVVALVVPALWAVAAAWAPGSLSMVPSARLTFDPRLF